jgi:hypothetical protein
LSPAAIGKTLAKPPTKYATTLNVACVTGPDERVCLDYRDPRRQAAREMFLERYAEPRRQIQRGIIKDAIASGELKRTTDPELLIDALFGPLFFRWLQGHAPLDNSFAERIFDKVLLAFR